MSFAEGYKAMAAKMGNRRPRRGPRQPRGAMPPQTVKGQVKPTQACENNMAQ